MFCLLNKASRERLGSLLAPVFSCPATIQMNTKCLCPSPLDCFSQRVYCSASLFSRGQTWHCLVHSQVKVLLGILDQLKIWLSQTRLCLTRSMWWAFVRAAVVTLPLVCVKGSYLSVSGRSSMPGVFTRTGANSSSSWLSSCTGANLVQVFQVCPRTNEAPFSMLFEEGKQSCVFLT